MVISNDGPPPAHLGDYPHGANWSADRPPAAEEDGPVDYSVSGPVIRFMWDYGVHVPLWDADALLPDEPQWLRQALQLSDSLIEDLTRWGPIFGHWWCASAHLSAAQAFNRAWSQCVPRLHA